MTASNDLTRQGIAALKAGDKQQAADLLKQAIREDANNQLAWLWLSGCVDSNEEKRECLVQVLTINNETEIASHARKGLEKLPKPEPKKPIKVHIPESATQKKVPKVPKAQPETPLPFQNQKISKFGMVLVMAVPIVCVWVAWAVWWDGGKASPTRTARTEAIPVLLDVPAILGKSTDTVNAKMGKPDYTHSLSPGSVSSIPLGGKAHTYCPNENFCIDVFFDQEGISKGMHIMMEGKYSFSDWKKLLAALNIPSTQPPDRTAPGAIYWDNVKGYAIAATGDPRTRKADLVNVKLLR